MDRLTGSNETAYGTCFLEVWVISLSLILHPRDGSFLTAYTHYLLRAAIFHLLRIPPTSYINVH